MHMRVDNHKLFSLETLFVPSYGVRPLERVKPDFYSASFSPLYCIFRWSTAVVCFRSLLKYFSMPRTPNCRELKSDLTPELFRLHTLRVRLMSTLQYVKYSCALWLHAPCEGRVYEVTTIFAEVCVNGSNTIYQPWSRRFET